MIIVFILTALPMFSQELYKGNISFTFNNEKYDLPLNTVSIRKENDLIISARGEKNDSFVQQMVSLEFSIERLGVDLQAGSIIFKDGIRDEHGKKLFGKTFAISFQSRDSRNNSGESLSYSTEVNRAQIEIYKSYNRSNWQAPAVIFTARIDEISYKNNELRIKGPFSAKFEKLEDKQSKTLVELKEGKFEIVL